jgi:hypothetical protein
MWHTVYHWHMVCQLCVTRKGRMWPSQWESRVDLVKVLK